MTQSPIGVLCLHGCNQTPEAFASYLSAVTKMAKKKAFSDPPIEFHFLKAPYEHPLGGLTWTDPPLNVDDIWHDYGNVHTRDNALTAVHKLARDNSILAQTWELMDQAISEKNITVLLGFSQGSFAIYEYLRQSHDPRIKRIVTMSGYPFKDLDRNEKPLGHAILNVVHPMDIVVPASLAYTNSEHIYRIEHNNKEFTEPCREAHVTPTRANHTRAICQFIQTGHTNE